MQFVGKLKMAGLQHAVSRMIKKISISKESAQVVLFNAPK